MLNILNGFKCTLWIVILILVGGSENITRHRALNHRYTRVTMYLKPGDKFRVQRLCWIHVQKASSWIGDFLVLQHCPHILEKYKEATRRHPSLQGIFIYDTMADKRKFISDPTCDVEFCPTLFGFHDPYEPFMRGYAVSIFRNPLDRIISAYLFDEGLMLPLGCDLDIKQFVFDIRKEQKGNITYPISEYVKLRGMTSCQTKMILGLKCCSSQRLPDNSIEMAKRILREEFLFVAITEESDATENLYKAMFHVIPDAPSNPRLKMYRQNKKHTNEKHRRLAQELKAANWSDTLDDEIYDEVKRIFYTRCRQYNVTTLFQYPQSMIMGEEYMVHLNPRFRPASMMSVDEQERKLAYFSRTKLKRSP